jgi:site-specific recombinase XerD
VFVTENGVPYSVPTMHRHFKVAKRIAGITRRLRVHDLRHSFGCGLATAGLPLRFIGKVMGHTDSATTERYARPDAVVLERVREAMDRER